MSQLKENMGSIDALNKLDEKAIKQIEEILQNQPEHPTF